MDKKKVLLIINPISGTGDKRGLEETVCARLDKVGMQVEVAMTSCRGDATRLAQKAVSDGFHGVIAAGGDGTVNETAVALCHSNVTLGILPCGSGNGLARHLNIPVDVADALEIIAAGHIVPCDYGTVNDRPFFCTFGMGFDAAVSEKFAREKRRGKLTYIRSTFLEYLRYNPEVYTISANGTVLTEKAFLVAVCNASQYGNNAYIAPKASLTDGLLDVTVVHSGSPLTTALVGVDLLTGYIDRNTLIHTFRTSEAVISRLSDGPAHIDGEPVTMGSEVEIHCHAGQLNVYTPVVDKPFKPIITPVQSFMRDVRYAIRHIFDKQ